MILILIDFSNPKKINFSLNILLLIRDNFKDNYNNNNNNIK